MILNRVIKIYATVCTMLLIWHGCSAQSNMKHQIEKELSVYEKIGEWVKKDSVHKKEGFLFTDSISYPAILSDIRHLKQRELLTDYSDLPGKKSHFPPTSIYIAGTNHITFFLKQENVGFSVYEHLLIYHGDAGVELVGISNLYSVNRDEEVNDLDIKVYKINGSSSYIVVRHDKVTGL